MTMIRQVIEISMSVCSELAIILEGGGGGGGRVMFLFLTLLQAVGGR